MEHLVRNRGEKGKGQMSVGGSSRHTEYVRKKVGESEMDDWQLLLAGPSGCGVDTRCEVEINSRNIPAYVGQ